MVRPIIAAAKKALLGDHHHDDYHPEWHRNQQQALQTTSGTGILPSTITSGQPVAVTGSKLNSNLGMGSTQAAVAGSGSATATSTASAQPAVLKAVAPATTHHGSHHSHHHHVSHHQHQQQSMTAAPMKVVQNSAVSTPLTSQVVSRSSGGPAVVPGSGLKVAPRDAHTALAPAGVM